MTPEEQEAAADRRATRYIVAAILFLIGILVLLLLAPINLPGLQSARQAVFGKGIAERVQAMQPGTKSEPEGNSIGRLPEEVQLRPPTNEVRAGAAGADEPAEQAGAAGGTNFIN
jgi:hypothetical protein